MPAKSEMALKWPVFRPRNWGKPAKQRHLPKPWFGLDTERDSKTGEFVCGFAVGEKLQEFRKMTDLENGTYWIWNLPYDSEGMLRDLNLEEAWAAKADGTEFPLMGGIAKYFHGKKFTWKAEGRRLDFIEASSFYNRCALAKIDKKFGEKDKRVDAKKMSLSRYESDMEYRRLVREYCIQDSRLVYNAITDLQMGIAALGVEIGATPGATARGFLNRLGEFPDILWRTQHQFLRSYCGGRFEIVKRGVFDEIIYQYDIASAYPWALSQCPWLTNTAESRWTNRFSDNALYGTYRVSFEYDCYLGIAPAWKEGIRTYSKAEKDTWLSRPEVAWLLNHGAQIKILRALEVFDDNATDLWRQVIGELYAMKSNAPDEATRRGAKVILNSQYGVLIQLIRRNGAWVPINEAKNPVDFAGKLALEEPPREFEGGKYYSPLYASNLTGLVRVKLLDAALAVGESAYIGGHTDSVLSRKPLPDSFLKKELGGWGLEEKATEAHICKTGMYSIGTKIKTRGITKVGTPDLLWKGEVERNVRCGIKSARDWKDVSVISKKMVANNLGVEKKRKWDRDFSLRLVETREWIDSEALAYVNTK